ncbi:hypothetical protein Vafri_21097 [Volvox africanus]|uniref:Uncharacterized protein n=1 Tax=Volvox africanus TaxID=51714 RepID=A0A8J4BS52_9CHLO|nr:hypothetical protein Vafri_21097 [Volvox africanus]
MAHQHQHQHQKQEQEQHQKEQLPRCGLQITAAAVPLLLLFLLCLTLPAMAQLPDKGQCISTASSQMGAITQFVSCGGGPTESCCSTVQGFAGPGSSLGYCLCYPDLEDQLLLLVESDPTAKRFGVTRDDVTSILQACNVPFASGTGGAACPAVGPAGPTTTVVAGAAPPAAAGAAGTTVAVSAPGTTVGVAPSGATTVRAPGTMVAVRYDLRRGT